MNAIVSNLYEYVKVGKFTGYLALILLALSSFKYARPYLPNIKISRRWVLILIFALGIGLRFVWLAYSSHEPRMTWDPRGMAETDLVNRYAIEMTQGIWFHDVNGQPTGRRPTGYPLLLGLLYKIFGINIWVAWTANVALFSAALFFLYRMTRNLFSEGAALIAALMFALYPISIYSVKLLTDENLYLPLWYAGLWLLFRNMRRGHSVFQWLPYGLLFGFAAMTRTHAIVMPAVIAAAYLVMKWPWRRMILHAVLTALVMQLVNLPWVIRNYKAWGVPVLYSATNHNLLYYHLNSKEPQDFGHAPVPGERGFSEEFARTLASGNEGKLHKLSGKMLKDHWRQYPLEIFSRGTSGVLFLMNVNKRGVWPLWHQYYEGHYDPKRPLPAPVKKKLENYAYAFYYVIFYSTLLAFFCLVRRRSTLTDLQQRMLAIFSLNFLLYLALQFIIFPDRKYRYPLEPLMMVASAYLYHYLLTSFRWEKNLPEFLKKMLFFLPRAQKD